MKPTETARLKRDGKEEEEEEEKERRNRNSNEVHRIASISGTNLS